MLLCIVVVCSFSLLRVSHCMNVSQIFIHSPVGHLGCFQFWAIMNEAAVSICAYVFSWSQSPPYFSCAMLRSETAWSYSKHKFLYKRLPYSFFFQSCTILYSHQQRLSIFVATHLHQHLMLSIFLILAILVSVVSRNFSLHFPDN